LARWREEPEVAALIDRLTEARAATKSKHAAKDWTPTPTLAEIREAAAAEALDLPPAIDDVRLHDLRRTVGSWLAQAGNSLHLIGRVLNHSNASTTQVYARFGEDNVRPPWNSTAPASWARLDSRQRPRGVPVPRAAND
jgi:integrase